MKLLSVTATQDTPHGNNGFLSLIVREDDGTIKTIDVHADHPHFQAIFTAARKGDASTVSFLLNNSKTPDEALLLLTKQDPNITCNFDDYSLSYGTINFGSDSALFVTQYITDLPFDDAVIEAVAKFLKRLATNQSYSVIHQLLQFLHACHNKDGGFAITDNGQLVLHKALMFEDDETGKSYHVGSAYVNGEYQQDQNIVQRVGDRVLMPRNEVEDDPYSACSFGLHAGTKNYATMFAQGKAHIAQVAVSPENVVSVPHDTDSQKVRCCEYRVVSLTPYSAPYVRREDSEEMVEENERLIADMFEEMFDDDGWIL